MVVFPAYNAERTLHQTYEEVRAQGVVDHMILVDDGSRDATVAAARGLPGLEVIEQWEPQVEHGTYGIEFLCTDLKFAKTANENWIAQGVVTEKLKR